MAAGSKARLYQNVQSAFYLPVTLIENKNCNFNQGFKWDCKTQRNKVRVDFKNPLFENNGTFKMFSQSLVLIGVSGVLRKSEDQLFKKLLKY